MTVVGSRRETFYARQPGIARSAGLRADAVQGADVDGASPSGKARDFESRIRRFESFRPNHTCPCTRSRRMTTPALTQTIGERVRQSQELV